VTKAHPIFESAARIGRILGASSKLVVHVLGHVDRLVNDLLTDSSEVTREAEALYAAAQGTAASVRQAVRTTPRFTRVLADILRVVAAYRIHAKKALVLSPEASARSLEALHRASAQRLHALCAELRGAILKVGQFASSRVDLLPEAYIEALSKLQDRAPPVPFEDIAAQIARELGKPPEALFRSIDPEPIATASLAQVHGALLEDGTSVVVKVQIPGIEESVEADLAALRVLARTLRDLLPEIDLVTIAEELCRTVRGELDYEAEAKNAIAFRENHADAAGIAVPRVYPERSARRVLTLERFEGARLVEFLDGCAERGEDGALERDRVLELVLQSFCAQVLVHGLFHADPHPGNFLVLPGPRLGILDFGSMMTYGEEERRAYAELAFAVLTRDGASVSERLGRIGFSTRGEDPDALRRFADLFLEAFQGGVALDALEIDARAQIERFLAMAKENPIVSVPQNFVMLGRVFATLGGLLLRYRPRLQLFAVLAPYLTQATSGL
jgi:predicted unusual protein kinase regulating ubiquinone biosynthesis (AarF/ABC1/UbiB family)